MFSLQAQQRVTVRYFWLSLWALAVGLLLLVLNATLANRPFDPQALRHFSAAVLEHGRRFTREVQIASTGQTLIQMLLLLWLCFSRRGARLLQRLERLGGEAPSWRQVLAVGVSLSLLTGLINLPIAYYIGYLHEQAYGLTRQTAGQWVGDYLQHGVFSLVLTLAFLLPLYALARRWPRHWWLPGAGLSLLLSGLMTLLGPVLWLPLVYEVAPVRDPAVLQMTARLFERAGVRMEEVRQLIVSQKTTRANAMVTGMGPSRRVFLYDTLLQQFAPAEVEAIVAHELAHAVYGDVVTGWLLSGAVTALTLFVACKMLSAMVGVAPLRLPAPHAGRGLALLLLALLLMGQITEPIENIQSRYTEVRADRYALALTRNPQALISGFKRLSAGNPSDVDPPVLVEFLTHSHPSVMNRIRAAEGSAHK